MRVAYTDSRDPSTKIPDYQSPIEKPQSPSYLELGSSGERRREQPHALQVHGWKGVLQEQGGSVGCRTVERLCFFPKAASLCIHGPRRKCQIIILHIP